MSKGWGMVRPYFGNHFPVEAWVWRVLPFNTALLGLGGWGWYCVNGKDKEMSVGLDRQAGATQMNCRWDAH